MENKEINVNVEEYKKFFKGLGKLLDIIGLLGVVFSIIFLIVLIFNFSQYLGKYSQLDYTGVALSLAISLLITFLGSKIKKRDYYSNWYLFVAFLIVFPMLFIGKVGLLGLILWILFVKRGIQGFIKIRQLKNDGFYPLIFDKNAPVNNNPSDNKYPEANNNFASKIGMEKVKSYYNNKNSHLILALLLFAIILGGSFYLLYFKPKQDVNKQIIQEVKYKKEKCLDNADRIRDKIKEENLNLSKVVYVNFENIFYSSRIDKCIYIEKSNFFGNFKDESAYLVKDAITDKIIEKFNINNQEADYEKFITDYSDEKVNF